MEPDWHVARQVAKWPLIQDKKFGNYCRSVVILENNENYSLSNASNEAVNSVTYGPKFVVNFAILDVLTFIVLFLTFKKKTILQPQKTTRMTHL